MPTVYRFNEQGEFIGIDFVDDSYKPSDFEAIVPDNANVNFHKFALVDGKLVEGKTEDEFFMDELISSLLPDAQELEKAEFEIKILTLLSEMEMF